MRAAQVLPRFMATAGRAAPLARGARARSERLLHRAADSRAAAQVPRGVSVWRGLGHWCGPGACVPIWPNWPARPDRPHIYIHIRPFVRVFRNVPNGENPRQTHRKI